ncbi:OadG family protein [Sulfurovum sp. XTW-4]|uniref:Probable oxaloacetate decarboxylase gamma chain n=1 Tax=Sulfurovum xiamenensis TaxID=3019066 RepID=A0ABT7QTM5_9BACT|nr:OadG family protein [Sulfurovum xiamenensis]MDM5264411.1 OadG family protein [Sulfurovum xiamenensis]
MEIDLVSEGLKFMVLGMLIVFIFLVILVQVMKLQAKIISKYFPDKAVEAAPVSTNAAQEAEKEAHHVAAIVAAIKEFRKQS